MKKRYMAVFPFIIAFGLMVSGCNPAKQISSFVDKQEDQSVLMFTYSEEDHSLGTLYYQMQNKEKEKIADNVKHDNYKLMPDSKAVLFIDNDNTLWYKAPDSEKEKISSNVFSFNFCKDETTISFTTTNDDNSDSPAELYIKKTDSEKEKIASDLGHYSRLDYDFFMSDNGDVIFWTNNDNNLYKKEGIGDKEKISAGVYWFDVKNNGDVYTYTTENGLYVKWANRTEPQKIYDKSGNILLCDDGISAVFKSDYVSDMVGELYMAISGGNSMKIASDIQHFERSADGKSLYYLNDENELYLKKLPEVTEKSAQNQTAFQEELKKAEKIKLGSDVVEYKISEDDKNCAFIDKDKNLYICYQQQEKVRFASDVETFSLFPEMVVYKDAENKLVLNSVLSDKENIQTNNKTLAENVSDFKTSPYGKYITFSTDEDNIMICVDGQPPEPILTEENEFDEVIYNGYSVYERNLKLADIAGVYQDESNGIVFKVDENCAMEFYRNGVSTANAQATVYGATRFWLGISCSKGDGTKESYDFNIENGGAKTLRIYSSESYGPYTLTKLEESELPAVLERHKLIGRGKNYVRNGAYVSSSQTLYSATNYGSATTYKYNFSGTKTILDYQLSGDGTTLWLKVSGSSDKKYDCFWFPAP